MKSSTIKWHLARDNQLQLAKFCDEHQIEREVSDYYEHKGVKGKFFKMTTYFDNGSYIVAELQQEVPINNYYQVIDYKI